MGNSFFSWPLALTLALALPLPVAAATADKAATKKAPVALADLSIKATRHGVDCPLPRNGACIIKKPVGTRYRVLTAGANLEDMGDFWLADFSKIKDPKMNRELLRVIGENGDAHEIEVRFPPYPAAKEKPAVKAVEVPKEPPKETPKEAETAK